VTAPPGPALPADLRLGIVARPGPGPGPWLPPHGLLDDAAAAGYDLVYLLLAWDRCQPEPDRCDEGVLGRYGAILEACHERGLEPVVGLVDRRLPRWLGARFWLHPAAPDRFAAWAAAAAGRLAPRCRHWVTLDGITTWAVASHLTAALPPGGRLAVGDAVRAMGHQLAAHVAAYEAIHAARPDALVATATHARPLYELDRLLLDVLLSRRHGIDRRELPAWLEGRRAGHYAALPPASLGHRALRVVSASTVPLDAAFPRAVAATYDSPYEATLDLLHVHHTRPGPTTLPPLRRGGAVGPRRLRGRLDRCTSLETYLAATAEAGLDIWLTGGPPDPRSRPGRPRNGGDPAGPVQTDLAAVARARSRGVPVTAYLHGPPGVPGAGPRALEPATAARTPPRPRR